MRLGQRRAVEPEARQRLAQRDACGGPGLVPEAARAWRPSSTTRRTAAISSSSSWRGSPGSGQSARCTDSGPSSTRTRQRWSARNGITGAITRRAWTSDHQSVSSAAASPSQKRRRERRMYQFERSSTYASKADVTAGVA